MALATLAGSVVGACSSVVATFIGQRLQTRAARLAGEWEVYREFFEEAVPLFVDAIQQSTIEAAKIMRLYSKVARVGRRLLEFL